MPEPIEGSRFVGPHVDADGRIEKFVLNVGNAESLHAMEEEYAFFTPAILYLHARFTDAPLIDCIWEMRQDVQLFHRKFSKPLFRGLTTRDRDADWNYVLWAVKLEHWEFLRNFISSITLSDSASKTLIRVGSQELDILDPLSLDNKKIISGELPRLKITCFGVNGNKLRAGLVPGLRPMLDPPILRFFPPADDIRVFAEAYYGGKNPLNARQNFLTEQKLKEKSDEGDA